RPGATCLERPRGGRQTGASLAGNVEIARAIHGGGKDGGVREGGKEAERRGDSPVFQYFETGTAAGGTAARAALVPALAGQVGPQVQKRRPHHGELLAWDGLRCKRRLAVPARRPSAEAMPFG